MKVSGIVDKIFEKPWKDNRRGNIILYSFKIKGNNNFFRLGENAPTFRETDKVEFEFDDNKVSDLVATKAAAPNPTQEASQTAGQSTSSAASSKNSSSVTRDDFWGAKEQRDLAKEERYQNVVEPRITFSSAQSDAVVLVTAALEFDCLSFGNSAKAAKLGMLLDYVDQVTIRFARQRMQAAELIGGREFVETEESDAGLPVGVTHDELG